LTGRRASLPSRWLRSRAGARPPWRRDGDGTDDRHELAACLSRLPSPPAARTQIQCGSTRS